MFTYKDLLDIAYEGALHRWTYYHTRVEQMPESIINRHREEKAWEALMEIQKLCTAYEQNEPPWE